MTASDDTREIPGTTDGECPACGSEFRSEAYYVPGGTGTPVTCTNDWHDEDAAGPGWPQVAAGVDDHEPTLTSIPACRAQDPAPATAVATVTALPGLPAPPGGFALLPCVSCGKTLTAGDEDAGETFIHSRLWQVAAAAGWGLSTDRAWHCPACQVPGSAVILHSGPQAMWLTYETARRDLYDHCADAADRIAAPNGAAARRIATMITDRLRTIQDVLQADPARPVAAIAAALNHVGDEITRTAEAEHAAACSRLADLIDAPGRAA